MFSFGTSKRIANIVIDDYVIRMVENNGKDLSSIKITAEKSLPANTIKNGEIIDELNFLKFMKESVAEWGIKNRYVRFYVPQDLIIMRDIDIPEKVNKEEIKQYITMEIGNTIHFPFKNPVFDLCDIQGEENVDKVTVLAAPEEEIIKYVEAFTDVKLLPLAVDAQALGIYRYYLKQQGNPHPDQVNLFFELNLKSVNISVFNQERIEFLRYQPLNIPMSDWQVSKEEQAISWNYIGDEAHLHNEIEEQVEELYRLMNFYSYSIHKGEKKVTNIVLLGDYPYLQDVKKKLQDRYELPVMSLTTENAELGSTFIPVQGLALKGVE